mmetsp:Transcript_3174/g.8988  ORF Transcript_3174/g.8988 Transcript_3174/m.8988 type:complete len:234 (-) Transcript_3174:74-775(-)
MRTCHPTEPASPQPCAWRPKSMRPRWLIGVLRLCACRPSCATILACTSKRSAAPAESEHRCAEFIRRGSAGRTYPARGNGVRSTQNATRCQLRARRRVQHGLQPSLRHRSRWLARGRYLGLRHRRRQPRATALTTATYDRLAKVTHRAARRTCQDFRRREALGASFPQTAFWTNISLDQRATSASRSRLWPASRVSLSAWRVRTAPCSRGQQRSSSKIVYWCVLNPSSASLSF